MRKLIKKFKLQLKKKKSYDYTVVKDMPDTLRSGILYIFDNNGYDWQIVMKCPCGCKTLLHINLIKDYDPNWSYWINSKNKISVEPSLHRKTGCRSHFFITAGKIIWC